MWWDRRAFTCGEVSIELGLPLSTTEEFLEENVALGNIVQLLPAELDKLCINGSTLAYTVVKRK